MDTLVLIYTFDPHNISQIMGRMDIRMNGKKLDRDELAMRLVSYETKPCHAVDFEKFVLIVTDQVEELVLLSPLFNHHMSLD